MTESGMSTILSASQPINAKLPISVIESGILMVDSDLHHEKTPYSIFVIKSGILICFSCSHSSNAPAPICVTVLGRVTDSKDEQPEKVFSLI